MMKTKKKWLRVMLDDDLMRNFKIICLEMNLSVPKQFSEIVRKFVEVQKENVEKLKKAKDV